MAPQQIPSGNQGLRCGLRGTSNRASPSFFYRRSLFGTKSPAMHRHLRRNGPVRVQFSSALPDRARGRRMNPSGPRHIAVLGRQAIELVSPREGGIYLDANFGAGGYSPAIPQGGGTPGIGIDRGPTAPLGGLDLVGRSGGGPTLVWGRGS